MPSLAPPETSFFPSASNPLCLLTVWEEREQAHQQIPPDEPTSPLLCEALLSHFACVNLTFSICQMGRKRIPLSPAYCKMGKTIRG